ncbi:histidine kinase [Actinosynnema sp. NPDC047251]|uniref:histidine kinase n=1 Tax=Saccharothrix espanaensis (strain ATCC 51144 / DSM 44229 / JCM 9112 / NBRC 15066 / NRRL 15764) TaxID=1179773 RepID=K0K718_SACES|nr:histidine kinase [Saccharothrix espanaensis]CCH32694.1 Sensor kinase [Saccharothrix espanaensis DSM 44229]
MLLGWQRLTPSTKDSALALVLTALAFVPTVSTIGPQLGDLPRRPVDALAFVLVIAQAAPLAIRRRMPAGCLAVIGTAFALHQSFGYPDTIAGIGLYLALFAVGAHQVGYRRVIAAMATAGYSGLAITLHLLGSPSQLQVFVVFYLSLVVMWMAGTAMRRWRAEEAENRRLSVEVATAGERARIARDLHDVVTHHVTAMVVQADAAQFLLDGAPEEVGRGLDAISVTGRRALTDLRHLLDVLEATGDSARADRSPTLGRVGDLVEQARLSGQPVELTRRGDQREHAVDVELAAYRVVQEALTNALKHAAGHLTRVEIDDHDDRIEIEVTTDGISAGTPAIGSGGRGLSGLRERVRMLDGELVAGARPEGGFRVHALIPSRRQA